MRRFASLDPFIETDPWNFRMGRLVANEQFLQALLRYSTFDVLHFFLADTAAVDSWTQKIVDKLPDGALRRRIAAQPATELRAALRDHSDIAVFHQGDFTYFQPALVALRNALGRRFPITGMTHSLDGLHGRFMQLALCGLQPYDAVVCTSVAAQQLVQHKLREVDGLLTQTFDKAVHTAVQTPRIPIGLGDDAFIPRTDLREQARASLGLAPDAVLFLSIGRLSMRSKVDWSPALEQWAALRADGQLQRAVLLIAGGGTPGDAAFLQSLIAHHLLRDSVQVLANFPAHRKADLYAAADVYVSLVDNFQETFGVSLVEAMAAGLPVVASDFDGFRDNVSHGESGFLVPTLTSTHLPEFLTHTLGLLEPSVVRLHLAQMVALDTAALRSFLVELYGNGELRRRMGERSRQMADALRWPQIIAAYEALWQDLAHQGQSCATASPLPPALTLGQGIDAYAHYATARLDDAMQMHITAAGRLLLDNPDHCVRLADVSAAANRAIERHLLQCVREGPVAVLTLRQQMQRFGRSSGDADYHLLWLIKHGAVAVA